MAHQSIFRNDILKGKRALVTGGASGIGLGIANHLAAAGADVAIASRRKDLCEEQASLITKTHGTKAVGLALNVRDPGSVRECFAGAAKALGGDSLDILVNNAAGNFYFPSHMLSDNQWKAVLEIDLYGTFHCCREAYAYMKKNGGSILSISMTLHLSGWACMLPACAAKSGIDAITRTLAVEWARHNIRVNAIAPGYVETEGVKKAFQLGGDLTSMRGIPLGRPGRVDEVADLAVYLCSPAATWITGEIVVIDGGGQLSAGGRGADPEALEQMILSSPEFAARKG
jgi:peroxisomal 2,4-dienoyl-CoA reductase